MKTILEIRAAEGGEDSKLFVSDLTQMYLKTFLKIGWIAHKGDSIDGFQSIIVSGNHPELKVECGGHRIQRVPPTERKGRVHTSTVTVAVLLEEDNHIDFNESDVKIEWFSGTGAGGQYRNKHQNSVKMTHIPTGIQESSQCRSRTNSYNNALDALRKRVLSLHHCSIKEQVSNERKQQVGSGMRGDKIRTYQFQNGFIIDHRSNNKYSLTQILKGNMNVFWK